MILIHELYSVIFAYWFLDQVYLFLTRGCLVFSIKRWLWVNVRIWAGQWELSAISFMTPPCFWDRISQCTKSSPIGKTSQSASPRDPPLSGCPVLRHRCMLLCLACCEGAHACTASDYQISHLLCPLKRLLQCSLIKYVVSKPWFLLRCSPNSRNMFYQNTYRLRENRPTLFCIPVGCGVGLEGRWPWWEQKEQSKRACQVNECIHAEIK